MAVSVLSNAVEYSPAIVIPVYNHEAAIGYTLSRALEYDCPVLLVDDGSEPICRDVLVELQQQYSDRVDLLCLEQNCGKGAAVKAGFRELFKKGFSHAIQVDADGQHDLTDLPVFLKMGRNNPTALVTGYPKYDDSVPRIRYFARYLTHIWVWINTLSFEIKDTMCGFRVYPLAPVVSLIDREPCGDRMDFDTEVIVRWAWQGGEIKHIPTQVRYPIDGISHFDVWKDNVLISLMHSRLFFGMLKRLPGIVRRKLNV